MERRIPLQRTPMKRSRTPIRPVSLTKKRRREQAEGPSMAELRPLLWKRCGGRCERCNRALEYDTFEAHHRQFRSRGGLDRIENLVALDGDCHRWAHASASEALPAGFAVLRTEDPRMVPLRIPFGAPVYLTPEGTYTRKTPREESA